MMIHEQMMLLDMLKESIRQGSTPSLTVTSNSMSPLLRAGDQIGLRELDPYEVPFGQIITFANRGDGAKLITHRVAGSFDESGEIKLVTFGDRSLLLDYPVAPENIVGQVIWRRRNNQLIDLQIGQGAWLVARLAQVASWNLKRISGIEIGSTILDGERINQAIKICQQQRLRPDTRIRLYFSYLWASLLTQYCEYHICSGKEL